MIFITCGVCVSILMASPFGVTVGLQLYLQIFNFMSFLLNGCCGEWEGYARKSVNHTSLVVVVTPNDSTEKSSMKTSWKVLFETATFTRIVWNGGWQGRKL